jgi:23S rRNA (guanosine2251-2'-O)-methyltransferase
MPKTQLDVYGRRPVLEAVRAGHAERVYIAREARDAPVLREIQDAARAAGVVVQTLPRAEFERLLVNRNHQGVAAAYHEHPYADLGDILAAAEGSGEPGLVLALDGVQDPGNVGSLLRSAEGAGVHGVVLPRHRAAGVTPAVVRASAGAAEHLAIAQEANLSRAIEGLKKSGYWSVGLSEDATARYDEFDALRPLVVVVGGEGKGLTRLVQEGCDYLVRLPMRGQVASLNAAVSGAILLYEIRRQRDRGIGSRESGVG